MVKNTQCGPHKDRLASAHTHGGEGSLIRAKLQSSILPVSDSGEHAVLSMTHTHTQEELTPICNQHRDAQRDRATSPPALLTKTFTKLLKKMTHDLKNKIK